MRAARLIGLTVAGLGVLLGATPAATQRPGAPLLAVSGVVRDEATGRPVYGAMVSVDELHRRIGTDSTGHYRFDSLAYRTYTVSARAVGYIVERRELHASCTVTVMDQRGRVVTPSRCSPPEETLNFYMRPERHID